MGVGAHMAALRRTKAGPVDEQDTLVTLDDLRDAMQYYREGNDTMLRNILHPIEIGVRHLPKYTSTVPLSQAYKTVATLHARASLLLTNLKKTIL